MMDDTAASVAEAFAHEARVRMDIEEEAATRSPIAFFEGASEEDAFHQHHSNACDAWVSEAFD